MCGSMSTTSPPTRRNSILLPRRGPTGRWIKYLQALKKLGLFGTRFTMQGHFYSDVFSRQGIALAVPVKDGQAYIHDKYFGELVKGIILPETRERLLTIVDQMKRTDGN